MKLSLLPFVCTPDSKETHVSGWPDIPLSLPLIIHTSYSITRSAGYLQTPPPSGTEYSGNNHPRQPHLRPTPTLPFLSATHIKSVKNKIPTKNKKQVRRFRKFYRIRFLGREQGRKMLRTRTNLPTEFYYTRSGVSSISAIGIGTSFYLYYNERVWWCPRLIVF